MGTDTSTLGCPPMSLNRKPIRIQLRVPTATALIRRPSEKIVGQPGLPGLAPRSAPGHDDEPQEQYTASERADQPLLAEDQQVQVVRGEQCLAVKARNGIFDVTARRQMQRRIPVPMGRKHLHPDPGKGLVPPHAGSRSPEVVPVTDRPVRIADRRCNRGDAGADAGGRLRAQRPNQHDDHGERDERGPQGESPYNGQQHDHRSAGGGEQRATAKRQQERHDQKRGESKQPYSGPSPVHQGEPDGRHDADTDDGGKAHHVKRPEGAHGPDILPGERRARPGDVLPSSDGTLDNRGDEQRHTHQSEVTPVANGKDQRDRDHDEQLDIPDEARHARQHVRRGERGHREAEHRHRHGDPDSTSGQPCAGPHTRYDGDGESGRGEVPRCDVHRRRHVPADRHTHEQQRQRRQPGRPRRHETHRQEQSGERPTKHILTSQG